MIRSHAPALARALRLGALALLPLAAAPPELAAQKHPMTLADMPLLKGVSDPQLAPGGRTVAYVRTTVDYEADRARSEIVLVPVGSGAARVLAEGTSPRWSPDGRTVAFLGGSGEQRGIWRVDAAGGEPRFVARVHSTDHFLGHRAVKGFAWSPDGTRIAFVGTEAPGPRPASDVKHVTRFLYKTRTGFSDNRVSHLWVVSAEGGEPRQVTRGRFDEHSPSWSPDGTRLAFISNRSADPDQNYQDDVWTVEVETGRETQVTRTVGTEFQPAWSPDGRSIAYLANVRVANTKDSSPEDTHVYVVPAGGGTGRALTMPLDRRVSEIAWRPGTGTMLLVASDTGTTAVFRLDAASGRITPVVRGPFQARSVSVGSDGTLVFLRTEMTRPVEVWVARADGSGMRQLSREQDALLAAVEMRGADSLWTTAPDGTPVHGWLMKPAGWQPGRRYPMVLSIHGGPHGMYGNAFVEDFQLLAARGYAVLFLNPRGSVGYGQHFADGTLMSWGGGDYSDLMAGVDAALARNPWIDGGRLGVVGKSYGGYMTDWIVTRTPRFRAAVSSAGVSNLISFYGTSLYPDLIETEFNGLPWDNYPLLWQWSPLAGIRNVRTPTLLLHGEADHDVPVTQSEEMYVALKRMGVPTEMVRYPGEGHATFVGRHRTDYLGRILDWFDRYVKEDSGAAAAR